MRFLLVGVVLLSGCTSIFRAMNGQPSEEEERRRSGNPCLGLRASDLAVCAFEQKTGCAHDDTQHTMDGKHRERAWWRVEGCGQQLDCWNVDGDESRMHCGWPHDVEAVKERLAIETGCPAASIEPIAQLRLYRGDGRNRVLQSVSWRLAACERAYACTSEVEPEILAALLRSPPGHWGDNEASKIECKLALDAK